MRLVDLDPQFLGSGGEGLTDSLTGLPVPYQHGVGISYDCPCGCGARRYVPFDVPLDGSKQKHPASNVWKRVGGTFDTLTLTPSILHTEPRGCGWHGYFTNGEVITL